MMENSMSIRSAVYFHFLLFLCAVFGISAGNGLTCFHCDDVLRPEHCTTLTPCGEDYQCSTTLQEYGLMHELRYQLGCTRSSVCKAIQSTPGLSICYECCATRKCNNRLCSSQNATTIAPTKPTTQSTTPTTTPVPTTHTYHFRPTVSMEHVVQGYIGSKIVIKCLFSGYPTPTVHWLFEKNNLPNNTHVSERHSTSRLVIYNATLSNSGTYTCNASNSEGLASASTSVVITGEKPVFIQKPASTMHLTEGDTAVLTCRASGNPEPDITWNFHLNHFTFEALGGFAESSDHTTMTINQAIADMTGTISCTVHNAFGTAVSTTSLIVSKATTTTTTSTTTTTPVKTTVHVHNTPEPITITLPASVTVMHGESTSIECSATGHPVPHITWSQLPDQFPHNVKQHDNSLLISHAMPYNSRIFMCEASNQYGNSIKLVQVIVQGVKPTFLKVPNNYTVNVNSALVLTCTASGLPEPEVTWTWTQNLQSSTTVDLQGLKSLPGVFTRKNNTELVIDPVYAIHHGYYGCIASNIYGSIKEYAYVNVTAHAVNEAPNILLSNQMVSSLYGNDIDVQYDVSGHPKPSVTWLFNNTSALQSNVNITDRNLVISRATASNEGTYSCVAHNTMGSDRVDVMITVIGQAPIFTAKPQSNTVLFGTSSTLHCSAAGIPEPSISWSFVSASGIKSLPSGVTFSADRTTMDMRSMHESGVFTCTAHNYYGQVSAHASIVVRTSNLIG